MNALAFDSLLFSHRLEDAGFTREQAEALAVEQANLIDERLATKDGLERHRLSLSADIESLRVSTSADLEATRRSLSGQIENLRISTNAALLTGLCDMKAEIIKWTVGIFGIQTVVILGAVVALARMNAH